MEKFVTPVTKKPYEETEKWQQRRCSEFRKHPSSVRCYGIIAHYGILGSEQIPLYFFPRPKKYSIGGIPTSVYCKADTQITSSPAVSGVVLSFELVSTDNRIWATVRNKKGILLVFKNHHHTKHLKANSVFLFAHDNIVVVPGGDPNFAEASCAKWVSYKTLDDEEKCAPPEPLEKRLTIRLHGGEQLTSDSVQYHETLLENGQRVFNPTGGPPTNDGNSAPECQVIGSCRRSSAPGRDEFAQRVFNPYMKRQKRDDETDAT